MCSFIVTQATLLCSGSKVAFKKPIPFFFFMWKAILYKQSYLSLQLFEKLHLTNV